MCAELKKLAKKIVAAQFALKKVTGERSDEDLLQTVDVFLFASG